MFGVYVSLFLDFDKFFIGWNDREECACNPVRFFVIISMERSGSGWFETLLNSHINVSSNGEIFSAKERRSNISAIVNTLDKVYDLDWFSSASRNECTAAIGFKWMLNQVCDVKELLLPVLPRLWSFHYPNVTFRWDGLGSPSSHCCVPGRRRMSWRQYLSLCNISIRIKSTYSIIHYNKNYFL